MKVSRHFLLLCIVIVSCHRSEQGIAENEILIEINQDSDFLINNKKVLRDSLTNILSGKIEDIEQLGYQRDEIVIILRVHQDVKMGVVASLESDLRNLEIRKLLYTTSD